MNTIATTTQAGQFDLNIYTIRGMRVMIDVDLAACYGTNTKRINQVRRRNPDKFPPDFAFPLTLQEAESSRSQFATLNKGRGSNIKHLPWVFTEHGAIVLAFLLRSQRANEVSVQITRAFIAMRAQLTATAAEERRIANPDADQLHTLMAYTRTLAPEEADAFARLVRKLARRWGFATQSRVVPGWGRQRVFGLQFLHACSQVWLANQKCARRAALPPPPIHLDIVYP